MLYLHESILIKKDLEPPNPTSPELMLAEVMGNDVVVVAASILHLSARAPASMPVVVVIQLS